MNSYLVIGFNLIFLGAQSCSIGNIGMMNQTTIESKQSDKQESNCISNSISFTGVDNGTYCDYVKEDSLVFKDGKAFENHYAAYHPAPVPPVDIDFSKEMVLAAYYGQKPNTGYSIKIKEIKKNNDSLEVIVEKTKPEPGKVYLMVITQPYDIIKLDKTDSKIVWVYDKK